LRDNFKPNKLSSSETSVNPRLTSRKSIYLKELDARKPRVVRIHSQESEELGLYDLLQNFTIAYTGLKCYCQMYLLAELFVFEG
jgi:hypothetical protein